MTVRTDDLEKELKHARASINELASRLGEVDSISNTQTTSILKPNYEFNIGRNTGADIVKIVKPQPRTKIHSKKSCSPLKKET